MFRRLQFSLLFLLFFSLLASSAFGSSEVVQNVTLSGSNLTWDVFDGARGYSIIWSKVGQTDVHTTAVGNVVSRSLETVCQLSASVEEQCVLDSDGQYELQVVAYFLAADNSQPSDTLTIEVSSGVASVPGAADPPDVTPSQKNQASTLILPKNNSTLVSENFALFWELASGETQYKYNIQLSRYRNMSSFVANETVTSPLSHHSVVVNCNANYYWRVRTKTQAGSWSNFSSVYKFTTDSCDKDLLFGSVTSGGVFTGSIVANGRMTEGEVVQYKGKLKELYSGITIAGDGMMARVHPEKDRYYFRSLDATMDWAEANGFDIKFHYLAEDSYSNTRKPDWYTNLNQADSRTELENHVRTITRKYKGRVDIYDAANHALRHGSNTNYMGTGWSRAEAISNVIKWANEEDPDATLIINEGGAWSMDTHVPQYVTLVNQIKARGAPIDGIGIMEHYGLDNAKLKSDKEIIDMLDTLSSETGLPIHITEFDIQYDQVPGGFNPEATFIVDGVEYATWWDYQAFAYKHAYELYSAHPAVETITFWGGIYDDNLDRVGTALLDESFEPKPVYASLKPILDGGLQKVITNPITGDECEPPWTNEKLINPDCFSIRNLEPITPGVVLTGHFDRPYPEGNKCANGKDERNKEFKLYIPEGEHSQYKLFVSVHGDFGNPDSYMNNVVLENTRETPYKKEFMDEQGIVVLAPHMKFWIQDYENLDGCEIDTFDAFFSNRGHRSDIYLLNLIDYLKTKIPNLETDKFYLYGHSRGGMFTSVFTQSHPERIEKAVAAGTVLFRQSASINEVNKDLREKQGTRMDFDTMIQNTSFAVVSGEEERYSRLCALKVFMCRSVATYCSNEIPDYCETDVWNAPQQVRMTALDLDPQGELVNNPCYAERPSEFGSVTCDVEGTIVPGGGHSGANNYPAAAEFLFKEFSTNISSAAASGYEPSFVLGDDYYKEGGDMITGLSGAGVYEGKNMSVKFIPVGASGNRTFVIFELYAHEEDELILVDTHTVTFSPDQPNKIINLREIFLDEDADQALENNLFIRKFFVSVYGYGYVQATQNILENPGFEYYGDLSRYGWTPWGNSLASDQSIVTSSGNNVVRLTSNGSRAYNVLSQTVVVEPGETYEFGGFIATNLTSGGCRIDLYKNPGLMNAEGNAYTHQVTGQNPVLQEHKIEVTIPSGITSVDFRLVQDGPPNGNCSFDNLFLKKIVELPPASQRIISSDLTFDDFYNSTGSPKVNIVVGSEASTETAVWAANIAAKLAEKARVARTVSVSTNMPGEAACTANPPVYISQARVRNPIVFVDIDSPSGSKIIIGNHLTNTFLADLADRLTHPGQKIVEVDAATGDIYVAGFTEADVEAAAQDLIISIREISKPGINCDRGICLEDIYNSNGRPNVNIVVGENAPTSHAIHAGNIASEIAENAVVTRNVTVTASGAGGGVTCTANPSSYLAPAPVRYPIVYDDGQVPAGPYILVGVEGETDLLDPYFDLLGGGGSVRILGVTTSGGNIIVAGSTQESLGGVARELIDTIDVIVNSSTASCDLPGDVDGDGEITCDDYDLIVELYGSESSSGGCLSASNNNGLVGVHELDDLAYYWPEGLVCENFPVVTCNVGQSVGDVDGDGEITELDATIIANISLGWLPMPTNICCGDVSGDGELNSTDSLLIVQIANGLREDPGLSCGNPSESLFGENLLSNHDFEESDDLLSSWEKWGVSVGTRELVDAEANNYALLTSGVGLYNVLSQTVDVEPGVTYAIQGLVVTDLTSGGCRIDIYNNPSLTTNANTPQIIGQYIGWNSSKIVVIPSDVSSVDFRLIQDGDPNGTCSFDDLSMRKITGTCSLPGDADGDGDVDCDDASLVMSYYLEKVGEDEIDLACADVTGDGLVRVLDVAGILRENNLSCSNVIQLERGWNLISIPVAEGLSVSELRSSCDIANSIWGYDAGYVGEQTKLEAGKGYLVNLREESCSVSVSGDMFYFDNFSIPRGLSLIGAGSVPREVSEILGTCPSDTEFFGFVSELYDVYDSSSGASQGSSISVPEKITGSSSPYPFYVPVLVLQPGVGYWVKNNSGESCQLESPSCDLPGDADGDGEITCDDFDFIVELYGSESSSGCLSSSNNDGLVGTQELNDLANNWPEGLSCDNFPVVTCSAGQLVGDVDGDGQLTGVDADIISNILVGVIPQPSNICCADWDQDGEIRITDAMYIRYITNGLIEDPGLICGEEPVVPGETLTLTIGEIGTTDSGVSVTFDGVDSYVCNSELFACVEEPESLVVRLTIVDGSTTATLNLRVNDGDGLETSVTLDTGSTISVNNSTAVCGGGIIGLLCGVNPSEMTIDVIVNSNLLAGNMLTNPDFERSDSSLAPWVPWGNSAGSDQVVVTSSGNNVVRLTSNGSRTYNALSQRVSVVPGETYLIGGSISTDTTAGGCRIDLYKRPGLMGSGNNSYTQQVYGQNPDLQEYNRKVTIPAGVNDVEFRLVQDGPPNGTCNFDNLFMRNVSSVWDISVGNISTEKYEDQEALDYQYDFSVLGDRTNMPDFTTTVTIVYGHDVVSILNIPVTPSEMVCGECPRHGGAYTLDPTKPGFYKVIIEADSGNNIPETDETNNLVEASFYYDGVNVRTDVQSEMLILNVGETGITDSGVSVTFDAVNSDICGLFCDSIPGNLDVGLTVSNGVSSELLEIALNETGTTASGVTVTLIGANNLECNSLYGIIPFTCSPNTEIFTITVIVGFGGPYVPPTFGDNLLVNPSFEENVNPEGVYGWEHLEGGEAYYTTGNPFGVSLDSTAPDGDYSFIIENNDSDLGTHWGLSQNIYVEPGEFTYGGKIKANIDSGFCAIHLQSIVRTSFNIGNTNEGEVIEGLVGAGEYEGQDLSVKIVQIVQTTEEIPEFRADFELYLGDASNYSNMISRVKDVKVGANLKDVFGDGLGGRFLSSSLYIDTIAVGSTTGIGYIEVTKGTDLIELYDGEAYPFVSAGNETKLYNVTIETGTQNPNSLYSIQISNYDEEWIDKGDTIPDYGPLIPGTHAEFLQLLPIGSLGKAFANVEFSGFRGNGSQDGDEVEFVIYGTEVVREITGVEVLELAQGETGTTDSGIVVSVGGIGTNSAEIAITENNYTSILFLNVGDSGATDNGTRVTLESVAEKAEISIGGELTYGAGAKTFRVPLNSTAGSSEVLTGLDGTNDDSALTDSQLPHLFNNAISQKINGEIVSLVVKEKIGVNIDALIEDGELVAKMDEGDFAYRVTLGSEENGLDLGSTSFTDDSSSAVKIILFGEEYELDVARLGDFKYVRLVKPSARETYNSGVIVLEDRSIVVSSSTNGWESFNEDFTVLGNVSLVNFKIIGDGEQNLEGVCSFDDLYIKKVVGSVPPVTPTPTICSYDFDCDDSITVADIEPINELYTNDVIFSSLNRPQCSNLATYITDLLAVNHDTLPPNEVTSVATTINMYIASGEETENICQPVLCTTPGVAGCVVPPTTDNDYVLITNNENPAVPVFDDGDTACASNETKTVCASVQRSCHNLTGNPTSEPWPDYTRASCSYDSSTFASNFDACVYRAACSTPAPTVCTDDGGSDYPIDSTWQEDCNTCTCETDGTISCTKMACTTPIVADIKVKYDWDWRNIAENECDVTNSNAIYCDATQFTIALLKKINAKSAGDSFNFNAYLMRDGYSNDFRKDFDYYYKNEFFVGDSEFYTRSTDGLHNYFYSPTNIGRFQFYNENESWTTGTTVGPGRYKVSVAIPEDFNPASPGSNSITVNFESVSPAVPDSIFYYMPFDAEVGLHGSGSLNRIGYGLGFSGNDTVDIPINASSTFDVSVLDSGDGVAKLKSAFTRTDLKELNEVANSGKLLSVTGSDIEFYLDFAPTIATPVLLEIQRGISELSSFSAMYNVTKGNNPFDFSDSFQDASDNYFVTWNSDSSSCIDFSGAIMDSKYNDYHDSLSSASDAGDFVNSTFGFNWQNVTKDGKVVLESIVYSNEKDDDAALSAYYSSTSPDHAVIIHSVSDSSQDNVFLDGTGNSVIDNPAKNIADLFELVSSGYAKIEISPGLVSGQTITSIVWDEEKLNEFIESKKEGIVSGCIASETPGDSSADLCGNGTLDAGEQCDGALIRVELCSSLGYDSGIIECSNCQPVTNACDCLSGKVYDADLQDCVNPASVIPSDPGDPNTPSEPSGGGTGIISGIANFIGNLIGNFLRALFGV